MSRDQLVPDVTTDTRFITMVEVTTGAAWMSIAGLLKLACKQNSGFNIRASVDSIPPPLLPTLQQQLVPHKPYVDMLP